MAATMEVALLVEAPPSAGTSGDLPKAAARYARAFEAPLVATVDPVSVCASGALGKLVAADAARFPRYEWMTDSGLDSLERVRQRRHEYGQLNFGDWAYDRYPRGWGN